MHTLIIDGYNTIYAIPKVERMLDESLQAAREGLVGLLSKLKALRGDIKEVFIVFDGKGDFSDEQTYATSGVKTVFTHSGKDADHKIIEIIKSSNRPDQITVISNDNYIYNNARAYGVGVESVNKLVAMLKKRELI